MFSGLVVSTHQGDGGSSTSAVEHSAARLAKVNAGTNRARALVALADAGYQGLTDFELADRTGVAQTSIGVRRKELCSLGLVERAPLHPRPSPSNSPAIVWRVTPAGVVKAAELKHHSAA